MLHHFFAHHGLGKEKVHLHADNWWAEQERHHGAVSALEGDDSGQHKKITLSFMIPGHTKFSSYWCFGLLKKKYRRTKVGGLTDLVGVVNESATVNVAQSTGWEDGSAFGDHVRLAGVLQDLLHKSAWN